MKVTDAGLAPEVSAQRAYYARTADRYDQMHLGDPEHVFALSVLVGLCGLLNVRSVLDVGAGTGRAVSHLRSALPNLFVRGIEPVAELREAARARGLTSDDIVDGNALSLPFRDGEFDLVCEFGVLHHIRTPDRAIAEMLRVARLAIFISDSNNFGQGPAGARAIKQGLRALGLWRVANFLKTRGRGYSVTEGDGLAYSYSVFSNYEQIRRACLSVHCVNTLPAGPNLYRTAGHVAIVGIKPQSSTPEQPL